MERFNISLDLSGERFTVVYGLTGGESEARGKAEDICVEQTIEFPRELVTGGDIPRYLLGRIESFGALGENRWEAAISFAVETVGSELTQLLNVIFGNFSMKPGVRVERLELPDVLLGAFKGPRFGIEGLRERLGVPERPLFCTALKPMGLSSEMLADLAYTFARGGVDLIKDDHGLADQPFAPFHDRVRRCAEAVNRANKETGGSCLYIPNATASTDKIVEKAIFAKQEGVGGLMVAPGLLGLDTMRQLADHDDISLPIISHPSFLGSHIISPVNGISHYALFGQLLRLAGADATIYPNYGGRFTFSRDDCRSIVRGATVPMGNIKPVFSAPGGGMNLERIPEMIETFGKDVIFLIGGALHKVGPDLVENCQRFMKAVLARKG
ncbi:MAG: ribulose 1,5-bisphosphate carboxylase large subunit [bacterium]|nr:ribulose 1,5-bisphosphate carboxylase large subunit [bacterium]